MSNYPPVTSTKCMEIPPIFSKLSGYFWQKSETSQAKYNKNVDIILVCAYDVCLE